MKKSTTVNSGPLLALLAAALFGVSTPAAKGLLGAGVDPWMLAGLLYAGAGIGLSLVFVARRGHAAEARLRGPDLPWLAGVVLAGGVLGPLLLMTGLSRTSAASASLLLNLEAIATMVIAWSVFREQVNRRLLTGAIAIVLGAVVLSYQGSGAFGIGALAIAGACVAWGVDNNLTRRISAADPVQIAAVKCLAAGFINLALAATRGAAWPDFVQLSQALVVGFLGYGCSLTLFVLALRDLGSARTGAYFSTAPFIGALLALVMWHEVPGVELLLAAALMGAGVYLHLSEQHEHEHAHETLEHEHGHVHDEHHQHRHAPSDPQGEPHVHWHLHAPLVHKHPHFPDIHHRHGH